MDVVARKPASRANRNFTEKRFNEGEVMTNAQLHGCEYEGWQCFHCGEVFTTVGGAEDHFGGAPLALAGCQIKVGAERGLLMELRKAENLLAKYRSEDSEIVVAMRKQQGRHADAIRLAEELGYERGLRDALLQQGVK